MASPAADLKVPAVHAEQMALAPSGPVYPAAQTLQSATAEPTLAVDLLVGQLHEGVTKTVLGVRGDNQTESKVDTDN